MQVSGWVVVGFYIWLLQAAVILIAVALLGAQKKRPSLTLFVGSFLVIGPLVGLRLGTSVAEVGSLAAMWVPLVGARILPAPHARPATGRLASARTNARPQPAPDDPYRLLGVAPGASLAEITAAWHRRAAECHPDTVAHLGAARQQAATERMIQINRAYEALRRSAHARPR